MSNGIERRLDPTPHVIREGVFGASFDKDGESLFLRMEFITEETSKCWSRYKELSSWMANSNGMGVLSNLVCQAGDPELQPKYETISRRTGFTIEEYTAFLEKAIKIKELTKNKIVELLCASSNASDHMGIYFNPEKIRFIVYVTKNPDFSIQSVDVNKNRSLKNYIESYNDILISVGSTFDEESFENRGIFRNPYWVFEQKYSGLSMLLHGFSGAVAERFFPEKKQMQVKPMGSMQCIIIKHLLPGEGHAVVQGEKKDLVDFKVEADDLEGPMNCIQVSALSRIYYQSIEKLLLHRT